jgi:hypothetical protein
MSSNEPVQAVTFSLGVEVFAVPVAQVFTSQDAALLADRQAHAA